MTNRPHAAKAFFNEPPDDKLMEVFRNICMRPAIYVGEEGYNAVCLFLQGLALGYQGWQQGFFHSWLNEEFCEFLIKRHGVGDNEWVKRCFWWQIYPMKLDRDGSVVDDKFLLKELLRNFDDFFNPLVRMAVETDDVMEDA